MEFPTSAEFWLTRLCFQRALAFIYVIGFLILINQFRALCGEHGLLPARLFLRRVRFREAPSLFHFNCSDRAFTLAAWTGFILSLFAVSGLSEQYGLAVHLAVWGMLWVLYLSFVNIGQTFYSFGWEILLLEAGFLTIFLGSADMAPPAVIMWLGRWLAFRMMFGAGLIKWRADRCWRDLTCLYYHYETQPLPNPLSRRLHYLPKPIHRLGVLFNHFVELIVPWGFFCPAPISDVAAGLTVLFQVILILSGNLSWLNYITIAVTVPCFDDRFLSHFLAFGPYPDPVFSWVHLSLVAAAAALILWLSRAPALNLLSPRQAMNASFDPLHLVNTYGAFGSVTRERMEIVIEGTEESDLTPQTLWKEYEFKAKPGDVRRMPPVISPYQPHLDWQMWFAAMSPYWQHPWFVHLLAKLLEGDRVVLGLLRRNPFPDAPPRYVRAELYLYRFAPPGERGVWWRRMRVRAYFPPISLDDPQFRDLLRRNEWRLRRER